MATVRVHTSAWTEAIELAAFNSLQVVYHGAVGSTPRPDNAQSVLWMGEASPYYMDTGDLWYNGDGIMYLNLIGDGEQIVPKSSDIFDPRKLAQYTRVSPTNAGGGDAEVVGAKWDSLSDTTCRNPTAGFPPSWGISSNNAVKGTNTNIALVRRGSSGTFGDGWRVSFMFFLDDTITNWTAPAATLGVRLFIGLSDQNPATVVGTDDPTGHRAGISFVNTNGGARTDTELKITTKDNVTETLTSTGITLETAKVYEVVLTQLPGDNIEYVIRNLTEDPFREEVSQIADVLSYGTIVNNLPTATLKAVAALNAVGAADKDVWLPHLTLTA